MKIAVTGASGLIGSALVTALRADGHRVARFVRRDAAADDEIGWDPGARRLDPAGLADVDAVVHLAGAGVGDRRWTTGYRRTVLRSRLDGTTTIAEAIAAAEPRPRVLLSASAVGFYGDTGDRWVDESAPSGDGFLADVCRQWEGATAPAGAAGVRVVLLRSGIVLSRDGGALAKQLPLFRLGLGGQLGSGQQYFSWITLADHVAAMRFLLTADVSGPVNLVAPEPVTNQEFTRSLGRALRRPTVMRVPGLPLRLALGEFAEEGLLAGQRVSPGVLEAAGYRFAHRDLDGALRSVLQDSARAR